MIADEGTEQAAQCVREEHPDDPDAHDFTVQGPPDEAVDGGQPWQVWIAQVHEVRSLLLSEVRADGTGRYGIFDDPHTADAATVAAIAQAVGLTVVLDVHGFYHEIVE